VLKLLGSWGSILLVSGTLAFGLDQALVSGASTHATVDAGPALAAPRPTEPGSTWVVLSSVDRHGDSANQACLTRGDLDRADTLELEPADMDRLATSLRCHS
jgi:hypothetical protein